MKLVNARHVIGHSKSEQAFECKALLFITFINNRILAN